MHTLIASVTFGVVFGLSQTAVASETRHAGAHTHGLNQVQMVLENNTLQIVYRMVGEQLAQSDDTHHHAHDAEKSLKHTENSKPHQHDTHDHKTHHQDHENDSKEIRLNALAALENHHSLFHLADKAQCTQTKYQSRLSDVVEKTQEHTHAHDSHPGHQDATLEYEFTCANPQQLSSIEFESLTTYEDLEAIDFEAIINGRAISTRVRRGEATVAL